MRGSHHIGELKSHPPGIIPAHAGLTISLIRQSVPFRDHPRACGAHLRRELLKLRDLGSSPRMRGSPMTPEIDNNYDGIIPAHAGLTRRDTATHHSPWDHPRACGAHGGRMVFPYCPMESSPRMRGSHFNYLL